MIELLERIYVAGDYACPPPRRDGDNGGDWAVVHACKSPCHKQAVGYRGNLDKTHPNYLVLEGERDLYLNMIDPPVPLFKPELFSAALRFADRHWNDGRKVLFHCNEGRSRAPSLILLYGAKVRSFFSNASFAEARRDFEGLYDIYLPGCGISTYLTEHWDEIGAA